MEIPHPSLGDLLELAASIAVQKPERFSRVAARWLLKYLEKVDDCTIDEAAYVAGTVAALGGRDHEQALSTLHGLAEATSRRRGSR